MKIYEIHTPELSAEVRYKVFPPSDIEEFRNSTHMLSEQEYQQLVLERTISNLKNEVTDALKGMPKEKARAALDGLYRGCLMLNPGYDLNHWLMISNNTRTIDASDRDVLLPAVSRPKKFTKTRFLQLERHLKEVVIGQDAAIEEICSALKRSVAGLSDDTRPLGVFLLAGPSGVGKSHLAKELHKFLFPSSELVRLDCGEFQHKHENQKLGGSPNGYVRSDEGGQFSEAVLKNPHSVVLLDEVEKAHPDIWDTFLRIFDEGKMTDNHGKEIPFKDTVIILTTNLGNSEVTESLVKRTAGFGKETERKPDRAYVIRTAKEAISKKFRPELINRIDKTIIFNHLSQEDMVQIAQLELEVVSEKLSKKGFSIQYDEDVPQALAKEAFNPVQGTRALAQFRRDKIENQLADLLLSNRYPRGTAFQVTWKHDCVVTAIKKPMKALPQTAGE